MRQSSDVGPPLAQPRISQFTAICVLVSNVIGGGIFTTTGFLARDIGDAWMILGLWVLGALVALAGSMVYAELGSMLPGVGGDYLYLREAWGPLIAFLSGWTSFTIGFGASIAASSAGFASYVVRLLPDANDDGTTGLILALGLIWILTAVHAAGVEAGGTLQRLLTTAKVTAIGVLIVGGVVAGHGHWDYLTTRSNGTNASLGSITVALVFVLYCYLGWNVVGYIAGEIAEPAATLPRVMIGGTAFVAAVYVGL